MSFRCCHYPFFSNIPHRYFCRVPIHVHNCYFNHEHPHDCPQDIHHTMQIGYAALPVWHRILKSVDGTSYGPYEEIEMWLKPGDANYGIFRDPEPAKDRLGYTAADFEVALKASLAYYTPPRGWLKADGQTVYTHLSGSRFSMFRSFLEDKNWLDTSVGHAIKLFLVTPEDPQFNLLLVHE